MNDGSRVLGNSDYEVLHDTTGMGGIMFDVVGVDDVVVTKLGFQFNTACDDDCRYDVYRLTKPGSYAGSEFDASAWTKIASGYAASPYPDGAVTGEFAVAVPAGATQAFYIDGAQAGVIAQETDARGVYESDENLLLLVGLGLSGSDGAPFSDGYGPDFSVNPNFVSVHYEVREVSDDGSRILGSSVDNDAPDNTGIGGIMFDVVGVDDVVVTKLGFQFNAAYDDGCPYDVYRLTQPGSYAGSEFDASAWTKIASGNAAATDPGGAVTGEFAVEVPAGATQAFYINGTERGLIAEKTDAQGVYESDEHLELRVGLGLFTDSDGAPFFDGYGPDYSVNPNFISVHYRT